MKNHWSKVQAWWARQVYANQLRWSRTSAKGKIRFVLWTVFWFNVMMFAINQGFEYFEQGRINTDALAFKLAGTFVVSVLLGFWMWSSNESKYCERLRQEIPTKDTLA